MGYPYYDLIPAAVLLDNPGVTRGQFVDLLNSTHCSHTMMGYSKYARWDSHGKGSTYLASSFHKGLHGLANLLYLKETEKYAEFKKKKFDEFGLPIEPPHLSVIPRMEGAKWVSPKFKVFGHIENIIAKEQRIVESWSCYKHKAGEVWNGQAHGLELAKIEKIIEEKFIGKKRKKYEDANSEPNYYYKFKVRDFKKITKTKIFDSINDLVKEHPQFDPDFMYDFSAGNGRLHADFFCEFYRWKKEGNLYHLDVDSTFSNTRILGKFSQYTDLILTAEAIKNKAWKLLSYRGKDQLTSFLKKFPESAERREKALWDSFTSVYARDRKMSHSELLRWRLVGCRIVCIENSHSIRETFL